MVSAEIENREAVRSLTLDSQLQSFSSPSSSLSFDETEEEKGVDAVSLSTASMSTNPTPDNPLYASTGGQASKQVKEYKSFVGKAKVSATVSNVTDGVDKTVEEIIRNTKQMEITSKKTTGIESTNFDEKSSREFTTTCLSNTGVANTALHEEFNKSPEPVPKRQMQQSLDTYPVVESDRFESNTLTTPLIDDSENDVNASSNRMRTPIRKTTTSAGDTDSYKYGSLIQSALNAPISPLGAGSPTGATLVLRDTNNEIPNKTNSTEKFSTPRASSSVGQDNNSSTFFFTPQYFCTKIAYAISRRVFDDGCDDFAVATWLGFWAYLNVSCANLILKPIMDAVVLELGVENQPKLILASSILAFLSSVPIGWLFEAPDPKRRKVFKKMGMTRGETQGTSLALFYRLFAFCATSYAVGFKLVDTEWIFGTSDSGEKLAMLTFLFKKSYQVVYIAFFLVIHLMKLHSTSLVWGVTTEAMEYEEIARKQHENASRNNPTKPKKAKTRFQRLSRIQLGGTLGSIWGSTLTSSLAETLHLPGLLVVSAILLEISAELSIELGRIMQKHWEEQQIFKSSQDLTSLDPSMKRSASVGSMKRVASSNTLYSTPMKRVASGNSIHSASKLSNNSLASMANADQQSRKLNEEGKQNVPINDVIDDNTFTQRLLRGVTTILKSRLLMTIFMYNALFSSINTLLSFQRAELVSNRKKDTTVSADTAFLANINFVSSIAMFAMQSSGTGSFITQMFGTRGSLALMPIIRLGGVVCLCWWHRSQDGQPPNLTLFLMLDEFTKVINQGVAKPVRESLWSDLNNEARYEAKPIIDVLANRWGAGSASFCVYVVSRVLILLGQTHVSYDDSMNPVVLGLPPVLFLGLIVSAWWVGVSLDLGQLRARIDMELKKLK